MGGTYNKAPGPPAGLAPFGMPPFDYSFSFFLQLTFRSPKGIVTSLSNVYLLEVQMKLMMWAAVAAVVCTATTSLRAETALENWQFRLSAYWNYTDNRDSADEYRDAETEEDLKQSTSDFGITPDIGWINRWSRDILELSYAPTWRYRTNPADNQNETEWQHKAYIGWEHATARRLSVSADNLFYYSDDPGFFEPGGEVLRADNTYYWNRTSLGFNYELSRKATLDFETDYMFKRYTEEEVAEEYDEDRLTGILRYERLHKRSLFLSTFGRYLLSQREDLTRETPEGDIELDRGLYAVAAGLGGRQVFSKYLQAHLDVGYEFVNYDSPDVDDNSSPLIDFRIINTPNEDHTITFDALYAILDAYRFPYSSQNHFHFFVGWDWSILDDLTFGLKCEYRIENYEADRIGTNIPESALEEIVDDGDVTTLFLRSYLRYQLPYEVDLKLAYSYEDTDSDVSATYTRNDVRLTVGKTFF